MNETVIIIMCVAFTLFAYFSALRQFAIWYHDYKVSRRKNPNLGAIDVAIVALAILITLSFTLYGLYQFLKPIL